ncbi:hypothetical protein JHD48_05645 [Sulfurimonas sp. SAG-AH-194-I05]|nr:hypothetical protein [Sulfurimonas sp. SAG-AH-194-I05]MDF1875208.1 hypothetical protein [Sulfurimonas sp. SAG-AH-194-I05]
MLFKFIGFFVQTYRKLTNYDPAYIIGSRGASGHNIYLTFGSNKTQTKDAQDSYKRYAMAMRHYDQKICNQESFIRGYNDTKHSLGA